MSTSLLAIAKDGGDAIYNSVELNMTAQELTSGDISVYAGSVRAAIPPLGQLLKNATSSYVIAYSTRVNPLSKLVDTVM